MRKPKISEFTEDDGDVDFDGYEEQMGNFYDSERDREIEERFMREEEDTGDHIHEQRRDERDEK